MVRRRPSNEAPSVKVNNHVLVPFGQLASLLLFIPYSNELLIAFTFLSFSGESESPEFESISSPLLVNSPRSGFFSFSEESSLKISLWYNLEFGFVWVVWGFCFGDSVSLFFFKLFLPSSWSVFDSSFFVFDFRQIRLLVH